MRIKINNETPCKLALLYLEAFLISPPLILGTVFRVVAVVMMTYIMLNAIRGRHNIYIVITFISIGLMVFFQMISGESITLKIQLYIMMMFVICFVYLCQVEDIRDYEYLLYFALVLFIVFNLCTFKALVENPHIMRYLVRNSVDGGMYQSKGVGGYTYIYSLILIIPIALSLLRETTKSRKIVILLFLLTSYLLVFSSGYLLAMMITTVMTASFFILITNKVSRYKGLWILVVLIITIAVFLSLGNILQFLSRLAGSSMIQKKLDDIYSIIYSSESISNTELVYRFERYSRDLSLTLRSPIFGCLDYNSVGKHSAILDVFAQFGIPVGVLTSLAIFRPLRMCAKRNNIANVVSLLGLFVVLLCNPVPMSIGIVYIVYPLIYRSNIEINEEI